MKIPKWFVIGFLVFFFVPYLAAFAPMLVEGFGEMFGFNILGKTIIDKIHMYVFFFFGAETIAFILGYITVHIIGGLTQGVFED